MSYDSFDYFLLVRLVVAALLGSLIGLERGRKKHEAGLRTHIILCLGSASTMVISECLVKQYGSGDILRMGAQVISGVGFLCAGSIITSGYKVKGITTAAGLWTTACVGLAVGSGYYIIAAVVVAIMLFAMFGLQSLSLKLDSIPMEYNIKIDLCNKDAIKEVLKTLVNKGAEIDSTTFKENDNDISFSLEVKLPEKSDLEELMSEAIAIKGVKEFKATQMGA